MKPAPLGTDETGRLNALESLGLLDTPPEERFDRLTKEAAERLKVPISTISLIDAKREWFKSCQGLPTKEGPREISFCGHAMFAQDVFIVEDTLEDERFRDNPYVIGPPYLRFYAGHALYNQSSGQPVGVFCIKDTQPRQLSVAELDIFLELATRAEAEINHPQAPTV
jgi:GAF domain-containing protein